MTATELLKTAPELKHTTLQAYLRNTGWQRFSLKRESAAVFRKTVANDIIEILLPLSREFADYDYRIYDVLEAIAKNEHRQVEQVITDLTVPPADVLRFRVHSRNTVSGTISFSDGFSLLESARLALFTMACDQIQPEHYHKRPRNRGAQQFIESCRLGQTEQGSFIASVICPFINQSPDDVPRQLSLFNEDYEFQTSFTRQVTTRLMRSLADVKLAIDRDEWQRLPDREDDIISGNFLESLLKMNTSQEQAEVEIMASWSPFAAQKLEVPVSVKFTQDYVPVLERLVEQMKPRNENIDDAFIGLVSSLKADPDADTRSEGEIVFDFMGGGERISKARVTLDRDTYAKANEAHLTGKTVRIRGVLKETGQQKFIDNPTFEVVE